MRKVLVLSKTNKDYKKCNYVKRHCTYTIHKAIYKINNTREAAELPMIPDSH